jgi:hypothetical protein
MNSSFLSYHKICGLVVLLIFHLTLMVKAGQDDTVLGVEELYRLDLLPEYSWSRAFGGLHLAGTRHGIGFYAIL